MSERSVAAEGPAFAARVEAFKRAAHGVWTGGAPSRASCRFERLAPGARSNWSFPDFEHHPCTPVMQAVGEAAWNDRGFVGQARIVPMMSEGDHSEHTAEDELRKARDESAKHGL